MLKVVLWLYNALYKYVIIMECPLYQSERYCLFRSLRETNKYIETVLFGNDEININEDSTIFNKVRAYIR